jgi:hypothetical protein
MYPPPCLTAECAVQKSRSYEALGKVIFDQWPLLIAFLIILVAATNRRK